MRELLFLLGTKPPPPSTMSSVDIMVNSGSEKVANQNVSVELVAQDMKKPGNKFDQIEWHYIYNGTDRKPLVIPK